jgi:predicted dithiol-disulfide oxidoreductase (DUF899 family)
MELTPIVGAEEWDEAREAMLVKEKQLTRARDALAAERRRMPRLEVEKDYVFEGPGGEKLSLLDLFEGRRHLVIYRLFYDPDVRGYPENACPGCSMVADQAAHPAHLNARGTTLAYVSRAPQENIQRLKERMGWIVPWYSLTDDWDADFGVGLWHGTNVFLRVGERIYRTYFIDGRGDEQLGSVFSYLDVTALGRQEEWEDSPEGYPQQRAGGWWERHDEYDPSQTDPWGPELDDEIEAADERARSAAAA